MNIERIKIRTERYAEEIGPSVMTSLAEAKTLFSYSVLNGYGDVICMARTDNGATFLQELFKSIAVKNWLSVQELCTGLPLNEYTMRAHVLRNGANQVIALFTNLTDAAFIRDLLPMLASPKAPA